MAEETRRTTPTSNNPIPNGAVPNRAVPNGTAPGNAVRGGSAGGSNAKSGSAQGNPGQGNPGQGRPAQGGSSQGGGAHAPHHKHRHRRGMTIQEKKLGVYRIMVILLAVALLVIVIVWVRNYVVSNRAQNEYDDIQQEVNNFELPENTQPPDTETEATGAFGEIAEFSGTDIPGKKLDWDALRQKNSDIYAWIYIPGTKVDYPILQHPTDDTYYLDHNLDGSSGYPGCIFTQTLNSKNFDDYNTVIYGHNMKNESMFRTLHCFEDEEFFSTHPYIYIYTENGVLAYEIFTAYTSDNAHILNTNDFSSEEGFAEYLQKTYGKARLNGWYREGVTSANRMITLSTCTSGTGSSNKRYLVQAVLLNKQQMPDMEDIPGQAPDVYDPFTGLGDDGGDASGLHKVTGDDLDNLEGQKPLEATGKE